MGKRIRDTLVAFFVTKEERQQMQDLAYQNRMTFSEYARYRLLDIPPKGKKYEQEQ